MAVLTLLLSLLFFGLISFRAGADLLSISSFHDGQIPSEVMNVPLLLTMLVIASMNIRYSAPNQTQAKIWKQTPVIVMFVIVLVAGISTYFLVLNDPAEANHKIRIFCDVLYLFPGLIVWLEVPKSLRSLRRNTGSART